MLIFLLLFEDCMSFKITREQILQGSSAGGYLHRLLNEAADCLAVHRTQRLPDKLARVVVASLPDYTEVEIVPRKLTSGKNVTKPVLFESVRMGTAHVYKVAVDTYNVLVKPIDIGVDA